MSNSLKNIKLPCYSKAEEFINTISHAFGVILGIVVLILSVTRSLEYKDTLTDFLYNIWCDYDCFIFNVNYLSRT